MALTSRKRALITVAVLVTLAAAGTGIYVRLHRPFASPAEGRVPDILDLLPADNPAIAYLDVAALRKLPDSPLAAVLGLSGTAPQGHDRDYTTFVLNTGFDYARDLDRVAIVFWPPASRDTRPANGAGSFLIIADGRFDEKKLAAYARHSGATTRSSPAIYSVPGNPPVSFEFISPSRVKLASGKNSEELLRLPSQSKRDVALQASINRVAGAPIFGVAQAARFSTDLYEIFKNEPQLERLVRSVDVITVAGEPHANHIELTVDSTCDSAKDALEVGTLLEISRMGTLMVLADPKTKRQMTPEQGLFLQRVVNDLKVTHQDRVVRLQLELTPELLTVANPPAATPAKRKP
jgi:hypothetical protein